MLLSAVKYECDTVPLMASSNYEQDKIAPPVEALCDNWEKCRLK